MEKTQEEVNVEMWKIKKLIKSLQEARGNGTSMISLILPVSNFAFNTKNTLII
jgi:peptide chain release factor subunit 1